MGDNGILRQAQYASFMSEMAAVEEAVQLWGADHYDDENHSIPAKGIVPESEMENSERLVGEVGYYREWSITNTKPLLDIMSDADSFNSGFASELVYFPGGTEDLYYLDNDGLNLNSNKKYLIDAVNSMVYSVQGISLNGTRCYSLAMAKAVMNGISDVPSFAIAEVSGGQTTGGEKLAGTSKYKKDEYGNYLYDEDGNLVENEEYNPYGFEIISDYSNSNVYKLYNNGTLYAKGLKDYSLNNSQTEMQDIDANYWYKLNVPISNYKQLVPSNDCYYVIDNNDNLWAIGSNGSNRFGLDSNQMMEFTGRELIQLNVDGKKVYKVVPGVSTTYAVTYDNGQYELYAAGRNDYGNLGIGTTDSPNKFTKVTGVSHPEYLYKVIQEDNDCYANILVMKNPSNNYYDFYFAGYNARFTTFGSAWETITEYVPFLEGTMGPNIHTLIKQIEFDTHTIIAIFSDCVARIGDASGDYTNTVLYQEGMSGVYKFTNATWGALDTDTIVINNVYASYSSSIKVFEGTKNNVPVYYMKAHTPTSVNIGAEFSSGNVVYDITSKIPNAFKSSSNKTIYNSGTNLYLIDKASKICYAAGSVSYLGLGSNVNSGEVIGFNNLQEATASLTNKLPPIKDIFYYDEDPSSTLNSIPFLVGTDNNIYVTGNSSIIFGNNILQQSWKKIADNVQKVTSYGASQVAYIDNQYDAHIIGTNTFILGLNNSNRNKLTSYQTIKDVYNNDADRDFYEKIDRNVKDVKFASNATYILTRDNELYVAGETVVGSWPSDYSIGISSEYSEIDDYNQTIMGSSKFIKILDNVEYFSANAMDKFAITKVLDEDDNPVYSFYQWGVADGGLSPAGATPIKIEQSSLNFQIDNVKKIQCGQRVNYVVTRDGKLYVCGTNRGAASITGLGGGAGSFTAFDQAKFNNEKVIDICSCNSATNTTIVLTDAGNIYGFGIANLLGLNRTDSAFEQTPVLLFSSANYGTNNKVQSIFAGSGFFGCVMENGAVWGTGSNSYGILGRWVGAGRGGSNSRYKTAINWVECPELEI